MRFATSIGLLALVLSLQADAAPLNKIKVAFDIYAGCMSGTALSSRLSSTKEVKPYLDDIDKLCIDWMIIWYQPVMGKGEPDMGSWDRNSMELLEKSRLSLLKDFSRHFTSELTK